MAYPGLSASLTPTDFPGDFDVEQNDILRRRALLGLNSQKPILQPQEVSGHYISPGWLGALVQALQGGLGAYGQGKLTQEEQGLAARRSKAATDWFAQMPMGTPASPGSAQPPAELGGGPAMPATDAVAPSRAEVASWATRGAGISPMTNKIAEGAVNKMVAGPSYAVEAGFDNNGREVKYIWDKNANQIVGTLGGPKMQATAHESTGPNGRQQTVVLDSNTGHQIGTLGPERKPNPTAEMQNTGFYKDTFGIGAPQAATLAGNLMTTTPVPQGGSLMATNKVELSGGAGAPAPGAAAPPGAAPVATPSAAPTPGGQPPASLTGPYAAPAPTAPGMRTVVPGSGGAQRLQTDIEQLQGKLTAEKLPQVEATIGPVKELLTKYPEGKVPGVGRLYNVIPAGLQGKEAEDVRTKIEIFKSEITRQAAGLSQTAPELAQVLKTLAQTPFSSEHAFRGAVENVEAVIAARRKNIEAGFDPQAVATYRNRLGSGGAGATGGFGEETREQRAMRLLQGQ